MQTWNSLLVGAQSTQVAAPGLVMSDDDAAGVGELLAEVIST
jgi:hypothetical protein